MVVIKIMRRNSFINSRGPGEVCGDGLAGSHVAVVVVPGAQRGGTLGTQLWCEA